MASFDDVLCSCQRCTRRQLHNGDQITLILFRDKSHLRVCKLQAGNRDQSRIDQEEYSERRTRRPVKLP